MRFSKKVNYGLVFLMQLHYAWPGHKAVKELAEADGLPQKFLEGIASDFRKTGFCEVKRGAQGGYKLARPLKDITLLEVIRCLDPEWERQTVVTSRERKSSKQEAVSLFLKDISHSVETVFGDVKLDALPALNKHEDTLMYYI
ncbi:RrF2 family transcriptional regulator [Marinilabilia rubra]|uniref:Rrf2 family transcriptional regulator n=1 Tax=Marinilabilia rubra TaxID=2162893 RepID=A0A2U2B4P5_9BACT|nr:Rrf2 family transcriptional regulator [Marinilabilia rubra]PWD98038.1 Rrf2 family transcriptional regulator [Marinilabilia rubra]